MDITEPQIPWYDPRAGLFDQEYLDEHGALPSQETAYEVDFLERTLELPAGGRILDLACGHGRHSLEFARRGYNVTGQDLSPPFLEAAEKQAYAENLRVDWVCRDMREVQAEGEYDAAMILFSSFGYLLDDQEDQKVVDAVARALKSGGVFILDVRNRDRIIQNYRSSSRQEFGNGTILTCESRFDLLTGRNVESYRRLSASGDERRIEAEIRLYTVPELGQMLQRAGLHLRQVFGGYDSQGLTFESKRVLLIASK